ncbi:hypothetical protein DFH27DRAFT_538765 [Peziza echinospora]|nr:hypothetical protein DFH27DRAFT_538765 [Peziza echinospora]
MEIVRHHEGPASAGMGLYMLAEFVEDLPLDTPEKEGVEITCVEARDENLYVGTSAHEMLHFVLLPPSVPGTPSQASRTANDFPSSKPSYILASRIQPPTATSALTNANQPFIKRILVLPGPSKILVLSSTGVLSFWTYPEVSPAYGGSVKVGGANYVGALDLDDQETGDNEASGGFPPQGSIGRRGQVVARDNSKMVMVMGKKVVKMVKVKEEEPRLVKNMECPSLIFGARRGPIACVATTTDYSLLHLEIGGIIPLFPILSTISSPTTPDVPRGSGDMPPPPPPPRRPSLRHSTSPQTQSEASDTDAGSATERLAVRRTSSSLATRSGPRGSSIQPRPRSEVFSATPPRLGGREELAASGKQHTRAVSTGSIRADRGRGSGSIGKNSPLGRGGSVGRITGREVSQDIGSVRRSTPSPTPPKPTSPSQGNQSQLPVPSTQGPRSATNSRSTTPNPTPPGSATSAHPKLKTPQAQGPTDKSSSTSAAIVLRPHIVSPTPNEFLLVTGTSATDPGVGMFVNKDGDPTRGTISISKYPEEIILDEGVIIAVLPYSEEDSCRYLEFIPLEGSELIQHTQEAFAEVNLPDLTANLGIAKVLRMEDIITAEVGRRLRFDRVRLFGAVEPSSQEPEQWEINRNSEELEAANRISKIGGNVLMYSGKQIWRVLPSPMAVKLDSRLPSPVTISPDGSDLTPEDIAEAREAADRRRAIILSVLKEVHGLEPTTERMFHEIAYIKQKCGILLLAEFLRLPREEDQRQFPTELLATEKALIEGSLDPRVVVSLFSGFEEELREGKTGVWVYGGVRDAIEALLEDRRQNKGDSSESDDKKLKWNGRRDILLLLRRYLSAWRQKKGFGSVSQADEKEVFWTIDAALMRCLLTLEATRSPSASRHMAGEVDVRTELYKMVDFPPTIECFDRCVYLLRKFRRLYVLSILYQSKRMSREVLETWKELFESGDEKMMEEFGEGEEKIAEYLLGKKDRDLIREYGIWLAKRNYKLGIKVFADERARVQWDVNEVLEILKEHAPDALRGFVEYLVVEKKNFTYANELLLIYLKSLTGILSTSESAKSALKSSYEAYRSLELPKPTYRAFLEENTLPASSSSSSSSSSGGEEDWWNQRLRFLDLLASASEVRASYDTDMVKENLEPYKDLLVAEMIVLYGRAGNHELALNLLVQQLQDFDGSVQYCFYGGKENSPMSGKKRAYNGVGKSKAVMDSTSGGGGTQIRREQQEELFGMLLVEALRLEDWVARQRWIEMLLERWGGYLDVVQVLSVIPDTYSIALLSKFLIGALKTLVRERSETVVIKAIRRGENLRVNAEFADKCDSIGPTIQTGGHGEGSSSSVVQQA